MLFRKKKKAETVETKKQDQSYWAYVKRQFSKNKRALYSLYVVFFLAFIALFADFIANEKPILCKYDGSWRAPVIKEYMVGLGLSKWPKEFQNVDWKTLEFEKAVWPLVPYLPHNHDYNSNYVGPFDKQNVKSLRWRHWLGTDDIGRDLLSGMIHGTRIAFMVGIVAMSIAFFIGMFFGSMAGFFGDNQLKMSIARVILNIIFFFFALFYGFTSRSYQMSDAFENGFGAFVGVFVVGLLIFIVIMAIPNLIAPVFDKVPVLGRKVNIPVDILVTRLIEVLNSIPTLVLILAVVAITKPSIFNVMAVIGLVRWTGIARFIRAELLRVRNLEYIEAATALGFSRIRSMLKHAVPNALSPVFIAVAFGIAAAILIESFLSFLGIGVPPETITWGKLLAIARTAPAAWWMAVFPGFAIFITVTLFNLIGEGLTDALDPRLKQ
ncbi:MAG: ABC transporter permease [Bacteroidota bacterium]